MRMVDYSPVLYDLPKILEIVGKKERITKFPKFHREVLLTAWCPICKTQYYINNNHKLIDREVGRFFKGVYS
jgi:hypothetical protein